MLYLGPLFYLGILQTRFGYADDFALLVTSPSLVTNSTALLESLQKH
jgi:hypothetical protein